MIERLSSRAGLSRRSALAAAAVGAVVSRARPTRAAAPVAARAVQDALPELGRLIEDAMRRTGVPGVAVVIDVQPDMRVAGTSLD